jgi:hypothetical protein
MSCTFFGRRFFQKSLIIVSVRICVGSKEIHSVQFYLFVVIALSFHFLHQLQQNKVTEFRKKNKERQSGCLRNMIVLFSEDGPNQVRELRARDFQYFGKVQAM